MKGNDDDAASLSDISNISSISLNNTDDEIDALTFCLKDGTAVKPQNVGMTLKKKMSPLKPGLFMAAIKIFLSMIILYFSTSLVIDTFIFRC